MTEPTVAVELGRDAAVGVVGMALLAAVVGLLATSGYRWASTRSPPAGASVVAGLAAVSAYLWFSAFGTGEILPNVPLEHQLTAGYLLATTLVASVGATAGSRLGDRIACQLLDIARIDASGEAAAAVRAARLAVDVELPETVESAEGYRPVGAAIERDLARETVRLPHGLEPDRRRERIERHLEREYGVGYASVELADDGTVDRVRVGGRSSGLGSMLPPETVAVAIRADPSPNASLGDPVEIWSTDGQRRLIATGTLRTANGSIATVIVDANLADDLSSDERYRLVTRPDDPTDGYEFASTLRTVDETVTTVRVDADSPLAGEFVGWLPGRVLVVDRDGELLSLPADNETLEVGDELWVLSSPAELGSFDPTEVDGSEAAM
ncbi:TrkA C-terminal domain-containing protein [Natrarchaeobius sp. A-rgal3]|uniref:TrkA C-terminal domain-containing protein n=1 Tax=Natrarchaeobius versutus TaxID=1679078 RepID=UPI00350EDF61